MRRTPADLAAALSWAVAWARGKAPALVASMHGVAMSFGKPFNAVCTLTSESIKLKHPIDEYAVL